MQKELKKKLEKMEKDQLIEIIDTLCSYKETERILKMMLAPTKKEIDRLIQNVSRCAEAYVCNSSSSRAYDKMIDSMEPIYAVLKYADSRLYAYIIYNIYQVARENDLFEIDSADFIYDLLEGLRYVLENDSDSFTDQEKIKYSIIVD